MAASTLSPSILVSVSDDKTIRVWSVSPDGRRAALARTMRGQMDDGRGGIHAEGNGLRGMRERIEALGGTVMRDTTAGTRLRFEFPLAASGNGNH